MSLLRWEEAAIVLPRLVGCIYRHYTGNGSDSVSDLESLNEEEYAETKSKKNDMLVLKPIPFDGLQENLRDVSEYIGKNFNIDNIILTGFLCFYLDDTCNFFHHPVVAESAHANKKFLWDKDRKIASKVFDSFDIERGKVYGKNKKEKSFYRELVAIANADTDNVELIADPVPRLLEMRKKDCEAVMEKFPSVHIYQYNNDVDYAYKIKPLVVEYFDPHQGGKCTLMAESVYVLNGIAYAVNQHGHIVIISLATEYCIVSSVLLSLFQFLRAYRITNMLIILVSRLIVAFFPRLWMFRILSTRLAIDINFYVLALALLLKLSMFLNKRLHDIEVFRNLATDAITTNSSMGQRNFESLLHTVEGTTPRKYSCCSIQELYGYKIITLHSRFSESELHFIFVVVFGIPVRLQ